MVRIGDDSMLTWILTSAALIIGVIAIVFIIRGLQDDYSYLNQDTKRFIDRRKK